jgi:hypothetical protein
VRISVFVLFDFIVFYSLSFFLLLFIEKININNKAISEEIFLITNI